MKPMILLSSALALILLAAACTSRTQDSRSMSEPNYGQEPGAVPSPSATPGALENPAATPQNQNSGN